MGVNSLPKTVTRQRRDCDLNLGPSAPDSSTLTTRLPSQPSARYRLLHGNVRSPAAAAPQQHGAGSATLTADVGS